MILTKEIFSCGELSSFIIQMHHAGLLILRTKDNIVTVNNNSPFQNYVHPDAQTQLTFFILNLLFFFAVLVTVAAVVVA